MLSTYSYMIWEMNQRERNSWMSFLHTCKRKVIHIKQATSISYQFKELRNCLPFGYRDKTVYFFVLH